MRQITGLSQKMVLTNDIVIIDSQAMSFFTSYQSISMKSISLLIFAYYLKVTSSPEVKILLLSTSSIRMYLCNYHYLISIAVKCILVVWTNRAYSRKGTFQKEHIPKTAHSKKKAHSKKSTFQKEQIPKRAHSK